MLDHGTYIAVFFLPQRRRLQVGKLGAFLFEPGFYLYTGSAQRHRCARLARHARRDKPLRWHIDYLSTEAPMIGAMLVPGPRRRECELAREIERLYELIVPGFGASDCRCAGHLFYTHRL
jgi:sugar fermentation stimulation protein A